MFAALAVEPAGRPTMYIWIQSVKAAGHIVAVLKFACVCFATEFSRVLCFSLLPQLAKKTNRYGKCVK